MSLVTTPKQIQQDLEENVKTHNFLMEELGKVQAQLEAHHKKTQKHLLDTLISMSVALGSIVLFAVLHYTLKIHVLWIWYGIASLYLVNIVGSKRDRKLKDQSKVLTNKADELLGAAMKSLVEIVRLGSLSGMSIQFERSGNKVVN